MSIKDIADKVKNVVQKEDAGELKDIASSEGSLSDKAKEGAKAVKDPGAQRKE